jgi:hypothetical protein
LLNIPVSHLSMRWISPDRRYTNPRPGRIRLVA